LHSLTQELSALTRWETRLTNALGYLRESIGYDVAGLLLAEKENKVYLVGEHLLHERARAQFRDQLLKSYNSLADRPVQRGELTFISKKDEPSNNGAISELVSYLSTPLVIFDEVLGIVAIASHSESTHRDEDLFTLSLAASQLSAYIGNIRFYQAARYHTEVAKSLKKQAQVERQQLETIIENLPEAVIIISAPDGQVATNNKKA